MDALLQTVPIEGIEVGAVPFALAWGPASPILIASLEASGILVPLTVWQRDRGRFTLVDGHRRCDWARRAGCRSLSCLVYPPDSDVNRLWRLRLEAKLCAPPLNPVEKARVVARYLDLAGPEELNRRVLPALAIRTGADSVEKWRRLAEAEADFLELLADDTIAERAALQLLDWPAGARRRALEVLRRLRASTGIQLELLEMVWEIARRQDLDPAAVLDQEAVARILAAPELNHRQQTQALRDLLFTLRYPRLAARTARVRQRLAAAGLPPRVRVRPPRFFEGGTWSLEVAFTTVPELQEAIEGTRIVAASGRIEEVMAGPKASSPKAEGTGGTNAGEAA